MWFRYFYRKKGWTICKKWRPWSESPFRGIWSGSALFANFQRSPDYIGLTMWIYAFWCADSKGPDQTAHLLFVYRIFWLVSVVQSDVSTTSDQVMGLIPVWEHSFFRIGREIFSPVIILLIQKGQLSVPGKECTLYWLTVQRTKPAQEKYGLVSWPVKCLWPLQCWLGL